MKAYFKTYKFQLIAVGVLVTASLFGAVPLEAAVPLFVLAAATFDIKNIVNQGRQQESRRVEYHYTIDFTKINAGAGLAATQDAEFGILPAGYVHERLDAVLRTAEGEASTLHVGVEADPDGFGVAIPMNGTINAKAAVGAPAFTGGEYFHVNTPIRAQTPAAAATLNVGKIDLTFAGYQVDTTLEK